MKRTLELWAFLALPLMRRRGICVLKKACHTPLAEGWKIVLLVLLSLLLLALLLVTYYKLFLDILTHSI